MPDKDSFYYLNAYQDGITPGQQMTIQHKISFNDWQADSHIAPLVGLAGEEIMRRKEASIALEKELYAKLKKLAAEWDEQAAQTMLLERALEYVHTPEAAHTSNEWKEGKNGIWEISNRTYIMRYQITYEKSADSYLVSWGIVYNAPKQPGSKYTNYWGDSIYVARQDKKKYASMEAAQHYIKAGLMCTVTCFGSCLHQSPMSAGECSASTVIWLADIHSPPRTKRSPASRRWMSCWPVWMMQTPPYPPLKKQSRIPLKRKKPSGKSPLL